MGDEQRFTRRNLLATGAVATSLLAGCTGGDDPSADDGADEQPDAASGTPTSTPTAPTLEEFEYPEGASQTEVDGSTLSDTHRTAITDAKSLTVELDEQRSYDGQGQSESVTKRWGSAGVSVVTDGDVTETLWSPSGEQVGYVQMDSGFDQRYRIDNQAPTAESVSEVSRFGALVAGVTWGEATEVKEDAAGDYAAVYEAEGVADEQKFSEVVFGEVTDLSATIAVSEAGHVSELSYDVTVDQDGSTVREAVEATVTAVGETDLQAPDWLETAEEDGVQFEMQLVEDGEVIELEMVNGTEVPSKAQANVSAGNNFGHSKLPEALSVGDRVNLALPADRELSVGVNEVPPETAPLGRFVNVRLQLEQFLLFEGEIHR